LDYAAVVARLRAAGCVFAEDEARLLLESTGRPEELSALLAQRVAGAPLEHVLGWVRFRGLRVAVTPGVFVPRRRTELLVERAAAVARPGAVVVELCCGCGAVGAALLAEVGALELYACDLDPAAVRCARRNLPTAHVLEGDLFAPLPATLRGHIEVLVANTPYVPSDEIALMPPEAREHEPRVALDGGPDGMRIQHRVAAAAPDWLAPGGHLLIESSERQSPALAAVFVENGLVPSIAKSDELGATVVIGALPVA
jgi:release factor glutamine methyltransferase